MTSLIAYHREHGRDFVELAGYALPGRYRSLVEEYAAAQTAAMIDRSFLGKVVVSGRDREALLHRLSTNEMRGLQPGDSRVNLFTNAKGRVVDMVEMLAGEDHYLLLTSPGRAALLCQWIDKYTFREDVKTTEVSGEWAVIALLGTRATPLLQDRFGTHAALPAGRSVKVSWRDHELWLHHPHAATIARYLLIVPATAAPALWQELLRDFMPVGFHVHESLRIRHGIPAADHEIVESYNPHEIGLLPFINFEKGCYIGQEVIARLDSYNKVQRRLMGLQLLSGPEPAAGAAVLAAAQEIGTVTSVAPAITGPFALALAVIRRAFAQPGSRVEVAGPQGNLPAILRELPFAADSD
ncbi:MAG: hypothetical protein ONB48_09005 [candidate division KSB1 bacterium]|nr:hypothetical protein [candidate division KSB1 bacterium]MDZ7275933.1 hypothetical protein [candidate division KSB1 bacterium]MDZ7285785.1 hypothetical protein [candidate division KSB1 bacterium]MDZ7298817.1 hypothetical protein [candidate division KSB1 bacterium]MDZ7309441.1 hypothetical protein [candidate division KSB1 bacterium]